MRVSTKEQARTGGGAEGYSIPAQRAACLTKAIQLGVVIEREYVDAGESARSANREQLSEPDALFERIRQAIREMKDEDQTPPDRSV